MLLSPILSQYWVSTLTLPPGGRDALMATAVLLVPQLAAVRLAWPRSASPAPRRALQ
jgi:hypothetical protein